MKNMMAVENWGHAEDLRIDYNKTYFTIVIPLLIACFAFVVELLSWYYFSEEHDFDILEIIHLFNTTFIPTHIATTTCFLYEFFSISKHLLTDNGRWKVRDEALDERYTALTIITTLVLAFLYLVLNAKVILATQIVLGIAQILYMILLLKVELKRVIHVYKMPIYNVVMASKS
jgi:hypothetical protein